VANKMEKDDLVRSQLLIAVTPAHHSRIAVHLGAGKYNMGWPNIATLRRCTQSWMNCLEQSVLAIAERPRTVRGLSSFARRRLIIRLPST
jgi:hypothetical protein